MREVLAKYAYHKYAITEDTVVANSDTEWGGSYS